jgi:hypothetical protein
MSARLISRESPHYSFRPVSIAVGRFLLERRRAGDCNVAGFEAVHEHFPGLSFYDFMSGFIFADCAEAGTLCLPEAGVLA